MAETSGPSKRTLTKESVASLTYYECLGFTPQELDQITSLAARQHELARRYRRLSLRFHPDKDSSAAAREVFEKLKLAVDVLGDSALRQAYDVSLVLGQSGYAGSAAAYQQADEKVRKATEELHQRERAVAARVRAAAAAEETRRQAAETVRQELTSSTVRSSLRELEDQVVLEWDIDKEMLEAKRKEVEGLLDLLVGAQKRPRSEVTTV